MFVTDSLFSLEFTVNKLTISPGVVCRFPAVAFRFLDFPTVSLHLLDEKQRDRLRTKLTVDPEYEIPDQIKDYQDKSGYYVFNSGKSCLYRIPPDDLRMLLAQVPLYIIVAEEFTDTPSLVGSAMLPLSEAMDEVYECLLKNGVSVPASSGVRSSLTVYNLMGHAIGQVVVGCQLTSLGMALLSHLPDSSVTSYQKCKHGVYMPSLLTGDIMESSNQAKQAKEKPTPETESLSAALLDMASDKAAEDYPIIYKEKKPKPPSTNQKENETQTANQKPAGIEILDGNLSDLEDEGIELITPHIYCPPPLYYNKSSHAQPILPYRESVDCSGSPTKRTKSKPEKQQESEFGKHFPESDPKYIEEKITTNKDSAIITTTGQEKPTAVASLNQLAEVVSRGAELSEDFPILNALVTEILKIREDSRPTPTFPYSGKAIPGKTVRLSSRRNTSPKRASTPIRSPGGFGSSNSSPATGRSFSPPSIVRRLSTPPTIQRPLSRQSSKKGPLVFGYTNTQKLRLSKTNPDYLRIIEQREADERQRKDDLKGGVDTSRHQSPPDVPRLRLKGIRGGRRKSGGGAHSFRSYVSQQTLDISTEMGKLTAELADVRKELAEQKAARTPRLEAPDITAMKADVELGITRILKPSTGRIVSPKPSVVTPGRSVSALSNRDSTAVLEHPSQSFQSSGDFSRRSLEIHIPTPQLEGPADSSAASSNQSKSSAGDHNSSGNLSRQHSVDKSAATNNDIPPLSQSPYEGESPGGADTDLSHTFSPSAANDYYGSDSFDSDN